MSRVDVVIRGAGVLVVAGVLAGGGSYIVGGGGGGGPTEGEAHLWVDINGGPCTRSSSPAEYVDASSCDTIQEAVNAATSGDTIAFDTDSGYEWMNIASGSKILTIEGNDSTLEGLTVNNIQVSMSDFNILRGPSHDGGATMECENCHDSVFDNFDISSNGQSGQMGFWFDGPDNIVQNSWIHNVVDQKAMELTGEAAGSQLLSNTFSDVFISGDVPDVHNECIYAAGADDLVIRNNTFRNCVTMDLFFTWSCSASAGGSCPGTGGAAYSGVTIENNVFGFSRFPVDEDENGSAHFVALTWHPNVGNLNNWRIVHNSMQQTMGGAGQSGYSGNVIANNLMPMDCWPSGTTYVNNVGADCGGTDVDASLATLQAGWVDPTVGVDNLHLLSGSIGRNAGDSAYATGPTATDRDGVSRDSTPDAGAFEYVP